jgi:hypothetical protein
MRSGLSDTPSISSSLTDLPDEMITEIVAKLFVTDPAAVFKLYLAYLPSKAGSYCKHTDKAGRIERLLRPFLSPLALTRCEITTRDREFMIIKSVGESELSNHYLRTIPAREDRVSLPHLKFLAKQLGSSTLSNCYKLLTNRDFELTVDYATLNTPQAIAWVNKGLVDFSRLDFQMGDIAVYDVLNNFTSLQTFYSDPYAYALQQALVRTGLAWMEEIFNSGNDVVRDVYGIYFNHPCFKQRAPTNLVTSALGFFRQQGLASSNGEDLSTSQKALQAGYLALKADAEKRREKNKSYDRKIGFSGQ